jgi:Protein of unknown function (DUF4038)/Putative collagen-binding domain of a collagenase
MNSRCSTSLLRLSVGALATVGLAACSDDPSSEQITSTVSLAEVRPAPSTEVVTSPSSAGGPASTEVVTSSSSAGGPAPSTEVVTSSSSAGDVTSHCAPKFPCMVSADGRYVLDGAGDPWFMVGDAGWSSLVMLSETESGHYFDALAAKGFNTVLVTLVETRYSNNPPYNLNGDAPFEDELFRSEPNEVYWRGLDAYVAQAAERGITLLATPAYLGYTGDGVADDVEDASNDEMAAYGEFLGDRYADAPNIIWVIGGDRSDVSSELLERMNGLATGIRARAGQLMSAHTAGGAPASDVYGSYPWLDLNNSYDITGAPAGAATASYEQLPVRPTFSIEGIYEQERDDPLPPGNQLLRYQAHGAVAAGSFGHVFGNNPRWHFQIDSPLHPYDGSWEDSLDDPDGDLDLGTQHMQRFAELWTSVPWQDLEPDRDDEFLVDGEGEGTEQAAARFDASSGVGVVYTVSKSAISLDLTTLSGVDEVVIRRFDPTSDATAELGTFPTRSTVELEHPGTNANGDADWLYIVEPTSP